MWTPGMEMGIGLETKPENGYPADFKFKGL